MALGKDYLSDYTVNKQSVIVVAQHVHLTCHREQLLRCVTKEFHKSLSSERSLQLLAEDMVRMVVIFAHISKLQLLTRRAEEGSTVFKIHILLSHSINNLYLCMLYL